jgi:beta-mannosidase
LQIFSKGFAQSVHVDVPCFVADDQYFHMIPNSTRTLMLRPRKSPALDPPQGVVHALNAASPGLIAVAS